MKRLPRQKQRQRLVDLLGHLMTASGIAGYVVGVVGSLVILYQLDYPLWLFILFIPAALVGSVGYGIPIGLMAGLPFMLLLDGLIKWLYPEDTSNSGDK